MEGARGGEGRPGRLREQMRVCIKVLSNGRPSRGGWQTYRESHAPSPCVTTPQAIHPSNSSIVVQIAFDRRKAAEVREARIADVRALLEL